MRWLARGGLGVALVAALALGRWIDDAWPTDRLDVRSFEHHAGVGERVGLRYADLRVEKVSATRTLYTGTEVATTTGTWLVLDVTLWARHAPYTGGSWTIHDARGRVFETDDRSGFLVRNATPKVAWHLRIPFELPAADLAGATLELAPSDVDQRREDVAVVDLGIDAAEAADLERQERPIPVVHSSSHQQPPLPGEPGYEKAIG